MSPSSCSLSASPSLSESESRECGWTEPSGTSELASCVPSPSSPPLLLSSSLRPWRDSREDQVKKLSTLISKVAPSQDGDTLPVGTVKLTRTKRVVSTPPRHDRRRLGRPVARPGMMINGYRCVERLGEGGFGDVWKCHDESNGSDAGYVAIKIMKVGPKMTWQKMILAEERRALCVLSENRHENIIEYYGDFLFTCNGRTFTYFMFELLSGDLYRRMKEGELSKADNEYILRCILDGLRHIHRLGCVHCDIKPPNIMFKEPNSLDVKIIDFGFAQQLESGQTEKTAVHMGGTMGYRAPESFDKLLNRGLDIWASGVILWKMYNGVSSFPLRIPSRKLPRQKQGALTRKDCERLRQDKTWLTPEWEQSPRGRDLCKRMLDPDYRTRITAEQAYAELEGQLN